MQSLRSLSRVAAATLLGTLAACADNITQAPGDAQAAVGVATSNGGRADATPTLNIVATSGFASVFSGPQPPTAGATYFTVEVNGAGFAAGEVFQSRHIGVNYGGGKFSFTNSIGQHPSDGSYRNIYSASCPSGMSEVYVVVQSAGRITESKHVSLPC